MAVAVRKETLKGMQRQVKLWAEQLRKPNNDGKHDGEVVMLAGLLEDAAAKLKTVLTNWPNSYGAVIDNNSKPIEKKEYPKT